MKFVFFGTSQFSVYLLEKLKKLGYSPTLIVTQEDKEKGRKMLLSPPPAKLWALKNNIPVIQPTKFSDELADKLRSLNCDLFIVASYGKIIPKEIFEIPPLKTLNAHPSLLPKYRGPSPIQQTILDGILETGTTIMRINEKMDEGPIVAQEKVTLKKLIPYEELERLLADKSAELLANTMPSWLARKIEERPQDHLAATYTKKISKEDGQIDLNADGFENYKKYLAYHSWPGVYFFLERAGQNLRVKITDVYFADNVFIIKKVLVEGKKEISFEEFKKSYLR